MRFFIAGACAAAVLAPSLVSAFPFGGQAYIVRPCYNNAVYVGLGPPRGGPFVFAPGTRLYEFGPPSHAGQWMLGLAGIPYYCIVSIQPVIVWSGTYMTMVGTSR